MADEAIKRESHADQHRHAKHTAQRAPQHRGESISLHVDNVGSAGVKIRYGRGFLQSGAVNVLVNRWRRAVEIFERDDAALVAQVANLETGRAVFLAHQCAPDLRLEACPK